MVFFNNYFLMHGRSKFEDAQPLKTSVICAVFGWSETPGRSHRSKAMKTYLDNVSRNWRVDKRADSI